MTITTKFVNCYLDLNMPMPSLMRIIGPILLYGCRKNRIRGRKGTSFFLTGFENHEMRKFNNFLSNAMRRLFL